MKTKARQFIKAWQTSDNVDEVAEKTGMTKRQCYSRASFYRSKGVELKKYRMTRYDWKELRELAKDVAKG